MIYVYLQAFFCCDNNSNIHAFRYKINVTIIALEIMIMALQIAQLTTHRNVKFNKQHINPSCPYPG